MIHLYDLDPNNSFLPTQRFRHEINGPIYKYSFDKFSSHLSVIYYIIDDEDVQFRLRLYDLSNRPIRPYYQPCENASSFSYLDRPMRGHRQVPYVQTGANYLLYSRTRESLLFRLLDYNSIQDNEPSLSFAPILGPSVNSTATTFFEKSTILATVELPPLKGHIANILCIYQTPSSSTSSHEIQITISYFASTERDRWNETIIYGFDLHVPILSSSWNSDALTQRLQFLERPIIGRTKDYIAFSFLKSLFTIDVTQSTSADYEFVVARTVFRNGEEEYLDVGLNVMEAINNDTMIVINAYNDVLILKRTLPLITPIGNNTSAEGSRYEKYEGLIDLLPDFDSPDDIHFRQPVIEFELAGDGVHNPNFVHAAELWKMTHVYEHGMKRVVSVIGYSDLESKDKNIGKAIVLTSNQLIAVLEWDQNGEASLSGSKSVLLAVDKFFQEKSEVVIAFVAVVLAFLYIEKNIQRRVRIFREQRQRGHGT